MSGFFLLSIFSGSPNLAPHAATRTIVDLSVFRKVMAPLAMSLKPPMPLHVHFVRNRLQVVGVHTSLIPARVVKLQPERNLALKKIIGYLMGAAASSLKADSRVSALIEASRPNPASSGAVGFCENTLGDIHCIFNTAWVGCNQC